MNVEVRVLIYTIAVLVLFLLVIPRDYELLGSSCENCHIHSTQNTMTNLKMALIQYRIKHGKYPEKLNEANVKNSDLKDFWRNRIIYIRNGDNITLRSNGCEDVEPMELSF